MPIEFRCINCQKLLRVGDDAVNKKARCPDCGTIQQPGSSFPVPGSNVSPLSPLDSARVGDDFANQQEPGFPFNSPNAFFPPLPTPGSVSNPFAPTSPSTAPSNPFADVNPSAAPYGQATANPYLAPHFVDPAPSNRELVRAKVQAPAIAMLITSGINVLFSLTNLLVMVFAWANARRNANVIEFVFSMLPIALSIGLGLAIIAGASKMRRLERYSLAMTAAVLCIAPCSYCCAISLPFGIWSLVVLLDPRTRDAFES